MATLLSTDLSRLKLADVEDFLGLHLPERERPVEGPKIDLKIALPQDIGKDVAAMSNTHGGLILVGVRSTRRKHNIPVALPGWQFAATDARAHITNLIITTVHPRPDFDVGLAVARAEAGTVAVVRVRAGSFPPYEFAQGATVQIPVRVQDTNRQATLKDIESLLAKRADSSKAASELVQAYRIPIGGDAAVFGPLGPRPSRNWQRIITLPRTILRLRMDSVFERNFERLVWSYFPEDPSHDVDFRRGGWYLLAAKRDGQHRVWDVWSTGAVRFTTGLRSEESLGDLAADFIRFCRFSSAFLTSQEFYGPVLLAHDLDCPQVRLHPTFPPPGGLGNYDTVSGIQFPETRPSVMADAAAVVEDLEVDALRSPETTVSQTLLHELREIWGAKVHFAKLQEAVSALARRVYATESPP